MSSCHYFAANSQRGELLAEVGSQQLFAAEATARLGDGVRTEDSTARLRQYIDDWVRRASLLEEAEQALGGDPRIEQLVTDYRHSLVLDRYRQQLYEATAQDSTMTDDELIRLYDQDGAVRELEESIARVVLVKVKHPIPEKDEFEAAWYSTTGEENFQAVKAYAKTYANLALLDRDRWMRVDELNALLPSGLAGSIRAGTRVAQADGYTYYLRILERFEAGESAPLAYVRPQLRAAAQQQHRAAFLAERTEASYRAARKRDAIKIYFDE